MKVLRMTGASILIVSFLAAHFCFGQSTAENIASKGPEAFDNRRIAMTPNQSWWQKTTIYQIYPRSFMDSNHDGIGDIRGIISRLDYIQDLGYEAIWISPFFRSPQQDWGYDVSDFYTISPEYGNLNDVEDLIEEVHKRGMRVLFDLVMNHTSIPVSYTHLTLPTN